MLHQTRIRNCGFESGSGIKIRAKVARIRVQSPYPANNGLDPDSFFLCLWFFFKFWCLWPLKERCRAKAKAKAKAKAIRTYFLWLRCVLWCGCLFLSIIVNWPFSFPIFSGQGSRSGLVPTYVVSQSWLMVTQSRPDPATSRRAAPRLMPSI
jgi:hypothetical protein